ncbi:MAG: flagellar assembly protein FliW [Oscillospiraceae bacterium]|jgi:flagellar assembly factor FliW|nr:flagellar assembly protein FliW [Oscillospiraceae bacterium]
MTIDTLRFGPVEVDEARVLIFKSGLPGLEEYTDFAVLRFEESFPIVWLQAVADRSICLPVIDTFSVAPEYTFDIADEDVAELSISGPEDFQVLSVLVIPENLENMTVNMAAPIIVNTATGKSKQIILGGGDHSARVPIFKEICALVREVTANAGTVKETQ